MRKYNYFVGQAYLVSGRATACTTGTPYLTPPCAVSCNSVVHISLVVEKEERTSRSWSWKRLETQSSVCFACRRRTGAVARARQNVQTLEHQTQSNVLLAFKYDYACSNCCMTLHRSLQ